MGKRRGDRLGVEEIAGFHSRLKEFVGQGSGAESETQFAARAGISKSGLNRVINGGMPALDVLVAIANAAGVSVQWLATGKGARSPDQLLGIIDDTFSLVRRYDVRASAGNGAMAVPDEIDGGDFVAFRADWLHRIGVSPRQAEVLIAVGDSMEPTIRDGDLLLIDRSFDRPKDNGIYVLVLGGMVLVKRVQTRRDGSVVLLSDNQRYENEVVPADELPDLKVEGRVRWFGRTI